MSPANGEDRMIRVWRWKDAPEELKALSTSGGDEDWLAWVPPLLAEVYFQFLESGANDVERIVRDDGSIVYIGAHA